MADNDFTSDVLKGESLEAAERAQDQRLEHDQVLKDIREVFGTEPGKRVLKLIFGMGRLGESVFTGNSKTYHLSGAQDLVQDLRDLVLEASPQTIVDLELERGHELRKARR